MQKKVLISIFIPIIVGIGVYLVNLDNESKLEEGITYAINVNGSQVDEYPTDGNYDVSISCTSGTVAEWDYKINGVKFTSINGPSKCNVSFTTSTSNNKALDDYIVDDIYSGVDGREGIYHTNNAEYRYTGLNPNNYIEFNDQMWRIIGVFNEASHGVSGQNLVKIISEESYTYAFDTGDDNSWSDADGGATLNSLYNDYYYMGLDGTSYAGCRRYSTTIPADCDFRKNGLDSESRAMVQSATWYLGGHSTTSVPTTSMYTYERGSTTSSGTNLSVQENIGLMYLSDYGYAAPNTCWEANLSSYNTASCGGANWLLKNQYEWTLVPYSSNSDIVFLVDFHGYVNLNSAYYGYASRPVLYLKSSVKYLSGTGSEADPFIIRY